MKVVTSDGKEFDVSIKILKMFKAISLQPSRDENLVNQLITVRGEIFARILEWCELHQNDMQSSGDEDQNDEDEDRDQKINDIPQWGVKFIAETPRSDVYETINACNYLGLEVSWFFS